MSDPAYRESWDNLQMRFSCCGVLLYSGGYMDWKGSYGSSNNSVPPSCCHLPAPGCGAGVLSGTTSLTAVATDGCFTVAQARLEQDLPFFLMVSCGVSLCVSCAVLISTIITWGSLRDRSRNKHYASYWRGDTLDLYTTKVTGEVL